MIKWECILKSFETVKHYANVSFIVIFGSFLTEEIASNHCDLE